MPNFFKTCTLKQRAAQKEEAVQTEVKKMTIDEIVTEATKLGMTYGQYQGVRYGKTKERLIK